MRTPSSSRDTICETTVRCRGGKIAGTDTPCTCPAEANCVECFIQPDRPGQPLLIRVDQQPVDSEVQGALGPCFLLNGDVVVACASFCQISTDCGAFYAKASTRECCMQSRFSTDLGYLERPGGSYYSKRQCSACDNGYVVNSASPPLPPFRDPDLNGQH